MNVRERHAQLIQQGLRIARSAARTVKVVLPDLRDVHVYGGGALVAIGAWLWFPPAAPIVFGALLLYLGLRK